MPPLTARAVIVSLLKTEGYGVVRWAIRNAMCAVVEGVLVRYQGVTGRRGWAESFRPTFFNAGNLAAVPLSSLWHD